MALFLLDRGNGSLFIRLLGVRWPPLGGPLETPGFHSVVDCTKVQS